MSATLPRRPDPHRQDPSMSTDQPVTYADLDHLRSARSIVADIGGTGDELDLLDRLIDVAEADAPDLPEGGIVIATQAGYSQRVYYHMNGALSRTHGSRGMPFDDRVEDWRADGWTVRPATVEDLAGGPDVT